MEIKTIASGSKANCYSVNDGETRLLIEAGVKRKKLLPAIDFKLSGISGVLVSHSHNDHSSAAAELMKTGLDVYMTSGTAKACKLKGHRLNIIKSGCPFKIGSCTITPFDTIHDADEPVGFFMRGKTGNLLFVTDTAYTEWKFPAFDYLMIECNYCADILQTNFAAGLMVKSLYDRIVASHMSLDTVKKFLADHDIRNLVETHLIHISERNGNPELMKAEIQAITGKPVHVV